MEIVDTTSGNKKFFFIALGIIALIVIVWMITKKNKVVASSFVDKKESDPAFPLKKGSKGKEAEQLQIFLLKNYGASFPLFGVDGNIGDETLRNMSKFLETESINKATFLKYEMDKLKTAINK